MQFYILELYGAFCTLKNHLFLGPQMGLQSFCTHKKCVQNSFFVVKIGTLPYLSSTFPSRGRVTLSKRCTQQPFAFIPLILLLLCFYFVLYKIELYWTKCTWELILHFSSRLILLSRSECILDGLHNLQAYPPLILQFFLTYPPLIIPYSYLSSIDLHLSYSIQHFLHFLAFFPLVSPSRAPADPEGEKNFFLSFYIVKIGFSLSSKYKTLNQKFSITTENFILGNGKLKDITPSNTFCIRKIQKYKRKGSFFQFGNSVPRESNFVPGRQFNLPELACRNGYKMIQNILYN